MEPSDKLNQILDSALSVFAYYGYKKASMDDIAARTGMTKGNLYFYCKNKQDLYEKTVAHALLRWQGRVREAIEAETDIVEKFRALALKSYQYLAEDADLRAVIIRDPAIQALSPTEERFPSIGRASYSLLGDILRQGVAEGRFRAIDVEAVTGFLYSVYSMFIIKTYIHSEGQSAQEMYLAGIDLILEGLLEQDGPRNTQKNQGS